MNSEKITFLQARDFGQTLNVSIKFIRQNFKLFFLSVICVAGPFLLISSVAAAYYQSNAINMFSLSRLGRFDNLLNQFGIAYFIFILSAIIANIAVTATVYAYMINYNLKGPGNFSVNDVARTVTKNIGNILAVFFVFFLLIVLVCAVIIGVFIGIGSASPILAVLLGIAVFFGLLILIPNVMWQLSVVYLIKMNGDLSVFQSWSKSRNVMRDNFWWTWLLVVCALIAIGIAGMVFGLPMAIYNMILMFSRIRGAEADTNILFLIVATVCTFLTSVLHSVFAMINGFHYFSLVEKKEGLGLMERINEIGTTPVSNVD